MKINEETVIIYEVRDCDESVIEEFNTRKEANEYIDDRDDHGYDTTLWSVVPVPHYNLPTE